MSYIHPKDVTAPKERWTLHRVLIEGGANEPAYALGAWDGKRCIGARWNGSDDNVTGWPRIFTNACWHILDDRLCDGVLAMLPNYSERIRAMRFLDGEDV
jgi:hypothetical protein